jgi:hypothetical protein
LVASLLAASIACAPESAPVFGESVSAETTMDASTMSDPASSSGAIATATDTGLEPGTCIDDADCGELRCNDGACFGCHNDADCPEQQGCSNFYCRPLDELPLCRQLESPVCGDDRIDAIEECEGTAACTNLSAEVDLLDCGVTECFCPCR